ncbi:MAG: ribonuclease HII [Candidatus Buchananbacteria bacterium]|nr:ribonuclease HII [Candidatus Buchananbacteria bacterium]
MKNPDWKRESGLWQRGYQYVAGIDEVGRGAWAGPIVAAGVIFERRKMIKGLKDSKKISAFKRKKLVEEIKYKALSCTVVVIDNTVIDEIGVGKANALVIDKVINGLSIRPQYLLIDKASVTKYKIRIPWETIVKGDNLVFSIASASILAKVARDDIMLKLAQKYPKYGFDLHKGYGTKLHQQMLSKYDICPIHRKSYKPISQRQLI